DVLANAFEQHESASVTALVLSQLDRAHLAARRDARFFPRQAAGDVLVDQLIEVELELLGELGFQPAAPEQRPQTETQRLVPAHDDLTTAHIDCTSTSRGLDDERDGGGEALPLGGLGLERFLPVSGELVVLRAAVVLADVPLGFDPSLLLELVQR